MSNWDVSIYDNSLKFVSDYGVELVDLLHPLKGENILDFGCGTGDLTKVIADKGASVEGFDRSKTMIEGARKKFPTIKFHEGDFHNFKFDHQFDAVFSNAVMHWIQPAIEPIEFIFNTLKPGGRFVFEMGAKGNVKKIIDSIQETISQNGFKTVDEKNVVFFPSIGEYTPILEQAGFEVRFCQVFDRPTLLLNGVQSCVDWIKVFGIALLQNVPLGEQENIIEKASSLMATRLEKDERFFADYRRLRVVAFKP
jgi:trans-aconitate methyltransferase